MSYSLAYSLHALVLAMDQSADKFLQAKHGISFNRLLLLITLQDAATPMNQHQLALALRRSDPAVSMILGELVKEELIAIAPDPAHKRKRLVLLTPKGDELVTSARQLLQDRFAAFIKTAGIDVNHYTEQTEQIYKALVQRKG